MTSFHSGTDMQELEDNAGVYNYYVSLVVSFDENYKCRVAFPATSKITQESTIRNTDGSLLPFVKTVEKEVHYIADLDVEIERLVPSIATWFSDRYEEVKKEKEKPKYTGYSNVGGFMGNYSQKSFYDVDDYSGYDFNSRYNENQFTYKSKMAEKESKVEGVPVNKGKLFTNAILYGQSFAPLNILRGVAQINIAKDEDFKNHMAVLNTNLDVFHDNIYGRNDLKMDDHIKEAINHLSQYSRPKEKNNLNVIIKYLEDYAKQ
jgi:hypothetical protein